MQKKTCFFELSRTIYFEYLSAYFCRVTILNFSRLQTNVPSKLRAVLSFCRALHKYWQDKLNTCFQSEASSTQWWVFKQLLSLSFYSKNNGDRWKKGFLFGIISDFPIFLPNPRCSLKKKKIFISISSLISLFCSRNQGVL